MKGRERQSIRALSIISPSMDLPSHGKNMDICLNPALIIKTSISAQTHHFAGLGCLNEISCSHGRITILKRQQDLLAELAKPFLNL